jgi:hypothetical protein
MTTSFLSQVRCGESPARHLSSVLPCYQDITGARPSGTIGQSTGLIATGV